MYDLAIVGSGWAGFNAALKARELGLKVCLIEKARIGGTCLNYGCIPTKTLIQSAKIFSLIKKADIFGLKSLSPQIALARIQERKDKIIQQLARGMQSMLGGIDFLNAEAKIIADDKLKVGSQTVDAKFILIATGSRLIELGYFKFDAKRIISSDDILNLKEIPDSLLIVGAGAIGCEFASLFSTLGSKVTMVEKMPQLIPGLDNEVARKIELIFKKRGILVNTNTDATTVDLKNYSLILVCVGRVPRLEGLGLETIGVKLEKGKILVNEYLKTNIDNIYAAGDCTGGAMLAHFAAYQGRIAAENISRPADPKKADNKNIPNCVFTEPQIASVGLSEEEAKIQGLDVKVNKFDFLGSGMARIINETEGFIKIISDKKTEQIQGASIIGPTAAELIGILTLAVTGRLKISQIRDTIFAHPTLSESIHEALK